MIPVYGAPEGVDALVLVRRLGEHSGPVLHIARDDGRLAGLAEAIGFFGPEVEVISFPAWDCLPYDRVSPNGAIIAERIAALSRLQAEPGKKRIVLTTVNAALQRVTPRSALAGAGMRLAVGDTIAPEDLAAFLDADGYNRTGTVMEPGEFSLRGGIVDVFPAGEAAPVRLDLFGDTIESIRRFDPETQRSGEAVARLDFHPASEVSFDTASVARFRTAWRELFGPKAVEDPLYHSVTEGHRHSGIEHYAPLFAEGMETLFDYLPGASVSLDSQAEGAVEARLELIADHYAERRGPARAGGEQDLLGERMGRFSRPPRRRKRADQFIAEATEIAEGDLVVHQDTASAATTGWKRSRSGRRAA
jgi:transcription-repair coupling factor (superfamily II helicase)